MKKTPTSRWLYRPTNETLFFKLNHAYRPTLPSWSTLNQYWSSKVSLQTELTYRYHWRFESMYKVNWENDFVSMIKYSSFTTVCIRKWISSYTAALNRCLYHDLPTMSDHRDQFARKSFKSTIHPTSSLHNLIPPPREHPSVTRLRVASKFSRIPTRTKKYQSFFSHALSHYQTS